jgi:glycosyltransferase involved in cell wall biosynthesis
MTKRVLIFSLSYVPFVGGAELALKEITDRIAPNEYAFDMITLRFDSALPRVERLGNITVHRIGWGARGAKVSDRAMPLVCKVSKVLFPLTAFLKALSLHRQDHYELIWAMLANQAGFAALFFKWMHPRIPYLLELQDGNSLEQVRTRDPIVRVLWPLYRRIYLRADRIKVISRFIENLAREVGYRKDIEVIPNGVDVARFSAETPHERLEELKARFGKKEGDVFLFTASRLVLSRGVEDAIGALARLPAHVKLLIAGDGEDKEKLEHIAAGLGVSERVIFAGHVTHKELPSLLHVSDIFVRPSLIEGMGSAFVEAYAAGVPIIGTAVGGIPDFLTDGVTGLFCEVRDPKSVAAAVEKYLQDPVLTARVVQNAKKLAAERYDWNDITEAMRERVFTPLIKRGITR